MHLELVSSIHLFLTLLSFFPTLQFSGHHGSWVDNDADAQRFDKQYYEEIYLSSWRTRNQGQSNQDWTTGRGEIDGNTRVMLNTDICLVHDIAGNLPCCTRTGETYPNGQDRCITAEASRRRCPVLQQSSSRYQARQIVGELLGGEFPNSNNQPFYDAFRQAWQRATTVGHANLRSLTDSCAELV